jgi:hypothetical protein
LRRPQPVHAARSVDRREPMAVPKKVFQILLNSGVRDTLSGSSAALLTDSSLASNT